MKPKYKRVLLKLSGEALAGEQGYGIDSSITTRLASEIKEIHDAGVQVAIIIGGGNIFRGVAGAANGMNRVAADSIGMLATLINSLTFKESLLAAGVETRVLSAVKIEDSAEYYIPERAMAHLNHGRVVIIAGGTGNPFFTTDTAAALRCAETQCEVLFKATKVDGIYDKDPAVHSDAVKLDNLNHIDALNKGIKVMDATAFSLCMDNRIPIVVFKLLKDGNLRKCIEGEPVGSTVYMEN